LKSTNYEEKGDMVKQLIRSAWVTAGLVATAPLAAAAHDGHAGEHGWLAGALQPLLSLDHVLAGAFVALVVTLGLMRLLRGRGVAEND
jgi:hydrogenase/urease accessory protein HupE